MCLRSVPQCLGRLFPLPTTSPSRAPPVILSGNPAMLARQAEKFSDKGDVDGDGAIDPAADSRLRTSPSKLPSQGDGDHVAWLGNKTVHAKSSNVIVMPEQETNTVDAVMKRHHGEVRVFEIPYYVPWEDGDGNVWVDPKMGLAGRAVALGRTHATRRTPWPASSSTPGAPAHNCIKVGAIVARSCDTPRRMCSQTAARLDSST